MLKKIEPWELEDQVAKTEFVRDETLTIAIVTLHNGMKLVGHSACINPADYDREIGENIARGNAVDQLWPLMAYHRFQNALEAQAEQAHVEAACEAETAPSLQPAPADD
jgi:hypothetical protein